MNNIYAHKTAWHARIVSNDGNQSRILKWIMPEGSTYESVYDKMHTMAQRTFEKGTYTYQISGTSIVEP
jgi:hypothetical protein